MTGGAASCLKLQQMALVNIYVEFLLQTFPKSYPSAICRMSSETISAERIHAKCIIIITRKKAAYGGLHSLAYT